MTENWVSVLVDDNSMGFLCIRAHENENNDMADFHFQVQSILPTFLAIMKPHIVDFS